MARTAELAFIVSVKSELDQLQRDLDRTNRSLGKLGGGFANTKKLAGDLERGLLVVGGAAIAGTAIAGKMAMDFEASMQKIVGLVGISQTQVDAWSKQLLLLGPKLGKGPEELADALYYVTSAGIKASDAIGVLEASAMASVAGLGTTSDIANAVTSAINAYGIENLSAARATDILTAAVKYGKMEAAEMAPVMGQVVPMASALKVSFDQVAGAMAVMSRTGMDASESAVSLNAIFTGMLKPSVEGRKELEAHGLSMAKLRDMIKQPGGVLEVMRLLDTTYGDDAEALAKVIPNVRSMRGLMNILAQDAGTVDEVMQGTTKSVGENGKAFRTAAETDLNKFNRALSQVQSSAIVYGFATLPQVTRAMTAAADVLADLTAGWMKLTPAEQDSRVNGALVAAAFLAVGYGAVKGASGVMVLTKAYGELKAAAIVANAAGGTAATGLVTGLVALSAGVNYLTYQAVMPAQVAFGDWIREMTGTQDAQEGVVRSIIEAVPAMRTYYDMAIGSARVTKIMGDESAGATDAAYLLAQAEAALGGITGPDLLAQSQAALGVEIEATTEAWKAQELAMAPSRSQMESLAAQVSDLHSKQKAYDEIKAKGNLKTAEGAAAHMALHDAQKLAAQSAGVMTDKQINAAVKSGILTKKMGEQAKKANDLDGKIDGVTQALDSVPSAVSATIKLHILGESKLRALLVDLDEAGIKHMGMGAVRFEASTKGDGSYAAGGFPSGPRTGYTVTLHGDEVVAPLNNVQSYLKIRSEADKRMGVSGGGSMTVVHLRQDFNIPTSIKSDTDIKALGKELAFETTIALRAAGVPV